MFVKHFINLKCISFHMSHHYILLFEVQYNIEALKAWVIDFHFHSLRNTHSERKLFSLDYETLGCHAVYRKFV